MDYCDREEHFWLIEIIAFWEGGVNSTHLTGQFGFSTAQAKKYLGLYQQHWPENLTYDPSLKAFIPNNRFQFKHINGDVSEYLDWLDQHSTHLVSNQTRLTNASLSLPRRTVEPKIMRALVRAMKQKRGVDIDYVSMTNPLGQSRIIHPHTFVKTGLRWHLRGYCELRADYADFVLSRFRGEPVIEDVRSPHIADDDSQWNRAVVLKFAPNPLLNRAQQVIIAQDYQMKNAVLHIQCRAALVHYLLQEMQVNIKDQSSKPEAQPLVLTNNDSIITYLFDANNSAENSNG